MQKLALLAIAGLFAGCISDIPLKSVNYNNLLNDSNSKVWIINKQVVNGVNIAQGLEQKKDLMIFYESGTVSLFPMKGLGTDTGKQGNYYLNSEEKTLELIFGEEEWIMDLAYITEDSIYMKHAENSDVAYDIQIKPLPEFNSK